jgi:hypothetical protein
MKAGHGVGSHGGALMSTREDDGISVIPVRIGHARWCNGDARGWWNRVQGELEWSRTEMTNLIREGGGAR